MARPWRTLLSSVRSCRRSLLVDAQTCLGEPLFEQPQAVVAPERFSFEQEERHAEDKIIGCFLLAALIRLATISHEIIKILLTGESEAFDQLCDSIRLVRFEFAKKEALERFAAVLKKPAMAFCEEAADRCRRGVVNFQRATNPEAARLGPATRIHVGVFDLMFGID